MLIGIDLGGTNIAVGAVDTDGKIIAKLSVPTNAGRPFEEIVRDMANACNRLMSNVRLDMSSLSAIGIGSPGAIDQNTGTVLYAANLNWNNAPLKSEMQKYFDIPINIENDANAAAYGEYIYYGDDINDFIFITLGTGIGGGIIINKEIYRGYGGVAAELGHSTFLYGGEVCPCGKKGCWEAYGSVTALINQTKKAISNNPKSEMCKVHNIDGRTAFDAAKHGDETAQTVVRQYIEYVADGICSMINIFKPEVLAIGGGISREGDYLLNPIREYCEKNVFCKTVKSTEIIAARLGNDAGIIGAALAAKNLQAF